MAVIAISQQRAIPHVNMFVDQGIRGTYVTELPTEDKADTGDAAMSTQYSNLLGLIYALVPARQGTSCVPMTLDTEEREEGRGKGGIQLLRVYFWCPSATIETT